ncbi:MAG TPA: hypothetical protein VIT24_03780 [Acidimicrobiales bacterium]
MSTETLLDLHNVMAWVMVGTNAVAGCWALAAHWVEALRGKALWWFTGLAQATIVIQVLLGVTLSSAKDLEAPEFHEFYGFVALIAAALIFSYRPQVKAYTYLLYGLGGLFLMGLGLRAIHLA